MDLNINYENIKTIIKYLKTLGYNFDNENIEYVESILTIPSSSRNELLFWVLKIFDLSYAVEKQESFDQSVKTDILNDLRSIGICDQSDWSSIDGSADPSIQLTFWKHLLDMGLLLKCDPNPDESCASDQVLHSIVHSQYYEKSLKDVDLIDEDIRATLESWSEKKMAPERRFSSLRDSRMSEEESLSTGLSGRESTRPLSPSRLLESISSLSVSNRALAALHQTHLNPYCKHATPSTSEEESAYHQMVLSTSRCCQELQSFRKNIDLFSAVDSNDEHIKHQMEKLNGERNNQGASHVLHSVVKAFKEENLSII